MTYKETGWYAFHHQYCVIPINSDIRDSLKKWPGAESAQFVLVYGCLDWKGTRHLVVLAAAEQISGLACKPDQECPETFIPMKDMEEEQVQFPEEYLTEWKRCFRDRIDQLHKGEEYSKFPTESYLKKAIETDKKEPSERNHTLALRYLRSSAVWVFGNNTLTDESVRAMEAGNAAFSSTEFIPVRSHDANGELCIQVYSDLSEIRGTMQDGYEQHSMPFSMLLELVLKEQAIKSIVLNPHTDAFRVKREEFAGTAAMEPLVPEQEDARFGGMDVIQAQLNTDVVLRIGHMDVFNFALYHNRVSPIRNVSIQNVSGSPISGLVMRITSDYDFFHVYEEELLPVPPGKPIRLPDPKLLIHNKTLSELDEAVDAVVTVEILRDGQIASMIRRTMHILAYDQWMGDDFKNYLPAFCIPTHPVQRKLLQETIECLKRVGKDPSIDGYLSKNPNRTMELAAAAYTAIYKQNIVYAIPPVSMWQGGQRIRTPEIIFRDHIATCMDMTLLYAGLLEKIGLNPILYATDDHIFAGFWLEDKKSFGDVCILENGNVVKRMEKGSEELVLVECTLMRSGGEPVFRQAVYNTADEYLSPEKFCFAIDVRKARNEKIKAIPARSSEVSELYILNQEEQSAQTTEENTESAEANEKKILTKKDIWETKLLELNARNVLLNLPRNASVLPIMSFRVDELEDVLSKGKEIRILPAHQWLTDGDGKEFLTGINHRIKTDGPYAITEWPSGENFDFGEMLRQDYKNHRIYAFCNDKQLDSRLTAIDRANRSSQQENGVSSLYLAIGMLRWYVSAEDEEANYAPLILLPIELIRKSVSQGYSLRIRDEEPRFNLTLKELLQQVYQIKLPELDPLPTDDSGLDIHKIFGMVRSKLFEEKGWDVVETCAIGNFSFAQFAMWNDIHSGGEFLEESPLVRSLIKGYLDWDPDENVTEPDNIYMPVTVDDTQLQAVRMAAAGKTFVLHGPPGTGKSQTITAMIANLMAQGKRVLFVAEKLVALQVVQKRLADLGIGDFCLELHSNKANKKQVLDQLERALNTAYPSGQSGYAVLREKSVQARAELDEYAQHLYEIRTCGLSMHDLIDRYLTVADVPQKIGFNLNAAAAISPTDLEQHIPLLEKLIAAGDAVGSIEEHPLNQMEMEDYSAGIRFLIEDAINTYRDALEALEKSAHKVTKLLKVDAAADRNGFSALLDTIYLYRQLKQIDRTGDYLLGIDMAPAFAWKDLSKAVAEATAVFEARFQPHVQTLDPDDFQKQWEKAGKGLISFLVEKNKNAITEQFRSFCRFPAEYSEIPSILDEVRQHRRRVQDCDAAEALLTDVQKQLLEQYADISEWNTAVNNAKRAKARIDSFPGGIDAIDQLIADADADIAFDEFEKLLAAANDAQMALAKLIRRIDHDDTEFSIPAEREYCDQLEENLGLIKNWGRYQQVKADCIRVGLAPVVEAYESGKVSDNLIGAYQKGLYYTLINHVMRSDGTLSGFSGASFSEAIRQFKQLDDELMERTKKEIYLKLMIGKPSITDSTAMRTELTLLRKVIGKPRSMSIRELFLQIPNVLHKLCPCMLMSPNSVAQYLRRDHELFDVVIFDEASQLPTCKAVGAMSRARSAVIVGDPKQMPPTSFFAGSGPEVEDIALADLDSILDDALALGIPSQYLQWHYRSTHESLIAFSNHSFYGNKMHTFPSANDRERHVTAVHVDGHYHNGTNAEEAQAIVAEIIRRYKTPELRNQSIGVVTFNIKQKDKIENLLKKQFEDDPALEAWSNYGQNTDDALFIKNLENVQGDERDVILFSVGFGAKKEGGDVAQSFGPITHAGGEKRLNVAFSRARVTMMVFETMTSADIRITESTPAGTVAFHDFLRYAEGRELDPGTPEGASGSMKAEGIIDSICSAIHDAGYETAVNIGQSDFHVDIAVPDPYQPTQYMLGILLDSDNYRDTHNTRDREVAQIGVLKHLGWDLYRIWTMDWWDNRPAEIKHLLSRLSECSETAKQRDAIRKAEEAAHESENALREAEEEQLRTTLARQSAELSDEDEDSEIGVNDHTAETESPTQEREKDNPANIERSTESVSAESTETSDAPESTTSSEQANLPDSEEQTVLHEDAQDTREPQPVSVDDLIRKLACKGAEFIDKRGISGILWVVGGDELKPEMDALAALGVEFKFEKDGAKATGRRSAWRAKTDIVIPD